MAAIELDGVAKRYGDTVVVRELSLSIGDGELVVLVGPSGCGKSTLLRMIAGLLEPSAGRIRIGGRDVTNLPPGARDIAMVFQSYALYPHMTVFDNIAFPLRVRRAGRDEMRRRVEEVAAVLGLENLLERQPKDLSGGQRQRVAMGRAIIRSPVAFLFDEPLSNLDAALRSRMRAEIAALHRRLGTTMIYVTHDQHEAMTLADRLVLLNGGVIEQQGAPLDVYRRPRTRFVGQFLGNPPMNFIPVEHRDGSLHCDGAPLPPALGASLSSPTSMPERLWLGVRPEDLQLTTAAEGEGLRARVDWIERTGSDGFLYAHLAGEQIIARLDAANRSDFQPGDEIELSFRAARFFDQRTGQACDAPPA